MLVIPIQGSFEEAKQGTLLAQKFGDMIEIRIDLLEKSDVGHVSKLKSFSKLPVIFTLRRKDQGGAFEGNEREREERLKELAELKPDYIDLEWDAPFADQLSCPLISSYHNFEETPEDLEAILQKMDRFPAAIKKIATMAHSSIDALRMLRCVHKHQVAGMCMGEKGRITRILGPVVGAPLVYASGVKETAPGQPSAQELADLYSFHRLAPHTKIYGLIGDPVDKSIGHLCHNHIFKKEKIDGVYVKIPLTPSEIPPFFQEIKGLPFYGLSVTMPLKEKVGPFLAASEMGAVNTLTRRQGEWYGTNTDGPGALDALEKKGKVHGKIVVIIGAGGAARGIVHEAASRGAKIVVASRSLEKGERLAKEVGGMATRLENLPEYDVLINTTPVGMSPDIQDLPICENEIQPKKCFFDVIMHPKETRFLNLAKNQGGKVVYGYEMFAEQALRQLKGWLDRPLNEEKILSSIESFSFF